MLRDESLASTSYVASGSRIEQIESALRWRQWRAANLPFAIVTPVL